MAAALTIGLLLAALSVADGSPASAKGKHGPVLWGASSCTYSGRLLSQIRVGSPKASMDKSLAKAGGTAQYVGLRVQLQGLKSGRWVKVANRPKKHDYAVTVKVHPRRKTSLRHAKLLTFKGSALPSAYSSFRVRTTVQWYAYNGHTIRGSLSRTSSACVRTKPAPPAAPPNVKEIQAGVAHACALMTNGSMRCWGYNGNGRLGDGTSTSRNRPITPKGMTSGVTSFTVANTSTCAVQNEVDRCWGANAHGKIGDGTTIDRVTATATKNLARAARVFGGGSSSSVCATSASQPLKCWGYNPTGAVGNSGTADVLTPYALTPVSGVMTAATGNGFGCAASPANTWCWGSNTASQMGTAASSGTHAPTKLATVPGASTITAGNSFVCALVSGGAVTCWGSDAEGQIGIGKVGGTSLPATPTGLSGGVSWLSAANASACAVKAGAVYCWGDNSYGQLGNGTTIAYSTPQPVQGISDATGVAVGQRMAYAWDSKGHVWAWGANPYGELATGDNSDRLSPVAVNIH